jgi:C1A family cysteine protease
MTTRKIKRYGWQRDLPDHRDVRYAAKRETMIALPPSVDLRALCPAPYDQEDLGSCTANAIAGAIQFGMMREAEPNPYTPSRLFIYFNERTIEGDASGDNGGQLRDGIKSVATQGYCSENAWPYDESQVCVAPPAALYGPAQKNIIKQYASIPQALIALKSCLAEGFPFVFGFTVFDAFESDDVANTGIVPTPGDNDAPIGGHAVLCVGYDSAAETFLCRNSWGSGFGMGGYFTLPTAYVLDANLASDFWQIQTV